MGYKKPLSCSVDTYVKVGPRGKFKFPHLIVTIPSAFTGRGRLTVKWMMKNRIDEMVKVFIEDGTCPPLDKGSIARVRFNMVITKGKDLNARNYTYDNTNVLGLLRPELPQTPLRELHVRNRL